MDKAKASIIKAIAMGNAKPALDSEYLETAIKALQWERPQVRDEKTGLLYQAFEDDIKRFMDGVQSAIVDNYTIYNILYNHFAIRYPLAQSINLGKKKAFSHYIDHLRHIISANEEQCILSAQEAIHDSEQQIKELRTDMESLKGYDPSAIRLENHQGNNRLLQFMEKIEEYEDGISINRVYIVLMQERKKQKQAFINSLKREDRRLILDYINEKHYCYDDVEKIIKDNVAYWNSFL